MKTATPGFSGDITIDASSVDEAIIIMTRTFDAPIETVWHAFTTPEHVKRWYGGHGFSSPVCEMDVRPGGIWTHTMRTPDGQEFAMQFEFVDVVEPTLISWRNTNPDQPNSPFNIVTFTADGPRTKWRLVAKFKSMADRDGAKNMGFANMVAQGSDKLNDIARSLSKTM
jgi:uncharacterized protein YndB with AHSA1/START domain